MIWSPRRWSTGSGDAAATAGILREPLAGVGQISGQQLLDPRFRPPETPGEKSVTPID
ncbi:hypothetical protein P4H83_19510 [Paenibacillus favisporus]|uniref:hypothetical protein n=1 Tax=Paenibacillus favisporus TaxID=221028 RepID=UPI002DB986BD|nr:hypothetical protein [Paenibacillus favisporus]MEC0177071.1 hypothetical protein [Paenibacillus favisporus]